MRPEDHPGLLEKGGSRERSRRLLRALEDLRIRGFEEEDS